VGDSGKKHRIGGIGGLTVSETEGYKEATRESHWTGSLRYDATGEASDRMVAGFCVFYTAVHADDRRRAARMDRETLIERLTAENEEFRRLRKEHKQHDVDLEALKGFAPLSADQEWRVTELKKLKLMAKDRMETLIRQASSRVAV
jgi:uncharacterized protein YdcH (DUF465 family)